MTAADTAALTDDQVADIAHRALIAADDEPGWATELALMQFVIRWAESEIRADQMRRDADLLDETASQAALDHPDAVTSDIGVVFYQGYRAAADRLRSGQPAGGQ